MNTELKRFIINEIVDSDTTSGRYIPKLKHHLSKYQIKAIESFIKDQKNKGVNFQSADNKDVDIKGLFEVSKILYEYYRSNEKVQKSDIKNLLSAIKLCAKHIKKCGFETEFRHLLDIRDTKYFHEYDLENYRHFFNEPLVQSLKKQSSKYPILLFNEVITLLDSINKRGYKNKETRFSQELKKLILEIFDMKTCVLRVEDKEEYEIDVKLFREAIGFYCETVNRYTDNTLMIDGLQDITIDDYESIVFTAYPLKEYENMLIIEEHHKETFEARFLEKKKIFHTIREHNKKHPK